jgi:hypothetical protein
VRGEYSVHLSGKFQQLILTSELTSVVYFTLNSLKR